MRLKRLILVCSALWFSGCGGVGSAITLNYFFANNTDKPILLEAYYDDGYHPVVAKLSFSIPCRDKVVVSGKYFAGHAHFFPFDGSNRVRISNGEKTVVYVSNFSGSWDETDNIFKWKCYEKWSCGRRATCYQYTFTDADFRDGVPIDHP